MIVALATSSKQLQVVQVAINWGTPQDNTKGAPATYPLSPSMKGRHIAISSWLPGGTTDSPTEVSMTQISHIELLPGVADAQKKLWVPAVVVTVRSFVPTAENPYNQEVQSILDRWEILMDQPQTLHPSVGNSGSRRNSTGSAPPVRLALSQVDGRF
jgi:mediator of RNA polymerase II transcription subunit 16